MVAVPRGERAQVRLPRRQRGAARRRKHSPPSQLPSRSREVTLEAAILHRAARRPGGRFGYKLKPDRHRSRHRFLVKPIRKTRWPRCGPVGHRRGAANPGPKDSAQPERVVGPVSRAASMPGAWLKVERPDTAAYFAWTRGTLVFDNTPLRERSRSFRGGTTSTFAWRTRRWAGFLQWQAGSDSHQAAGPARRLTGIRAGQGG